MGCMHLMFDSIYSQQVNSDDGDSLENAISETQPETGQSDSSSSIRLSNLGTSHNFSEEAHSRNDTKHQQEPSLYIDGVRKSMKVEFNRDKYHAIQVKSAPGVL